MATTRSRSLQALRAAFDNGNGNDITPKTASTKRNFTVPKSAANYYSDRPLVALEASYVPVSKSSPSNGQARSATSRSSLKPTTTGVSPSERTTTSTPKSLVVTLQQVPVSKSTPSHGQAKRTSSLKPSVLNTPTGKSYSSSPRKASSSNRSVSSNRFIESPLKSPPPKQTTSPGGTSSDLERSLSSLTKSPCSSPANSKAGRWDKKRATPSSQNSTSSLRSMATAVTVDSEQSWSTLGESSSLQRTKSNSSLSTLGDSYCWDLEENSRRTLTTPVASCSTPKSKQSNSCLSATPKYSRTPKAVTPTKLVLRHTPSGITPSSKSKRRSRSFRIQLPDLEIPPPKETFETEKKRIAELEAKLKSIQSRKCEELSQIKAQTAKEKKQWEDQVEESRKRVAKLMPDKQAKRILRDNSKTIQKLKKENAEILKQTNEIRRNVIALRINNERLIEFTKDSNTSKSNLEYHHNIASKASDKLAANHKKLEGQVKQHVQEVVQLIQQGSAEHNGRVTFEQGLQDILEMVEGSGLEELIAAVQADLDLLDEHGNGGIYSFMRSSMQRSIAVSALSCNDRCTAASLPGC